MSMAWSFCWQEFLASVGIRRWIHAKQRNPTCCSPSQLSLPDEKSVSCWPPSTPELREGESIRMCWTLCSSSMWKGLSLMNCCVSLALRRSATYFLNVPFLPRKLSSPSSIDHGGGWMEVEGGLASALFSLSSINTVLCGPNHLLSSFEGLGPSPMPVVVARDSLCWTRVLLSSVALECQNFLSSFSTSGLRGFFGSLLPVSLHMRPSHTKDIFARSLALGSSQAMSMTTLCSMAVLQKPTRTPFLANHRTNASACGLFHT